MMTQPDYKLWEEIRRQEEQAALEAEKEFNKILKEIYCGGSLDVEEE